MSESKPSKLGPNSSYEERYERVLGEIGPALRGISLRTPKERELFLELFKWYVRLDWLAKKHFRTETLTVHQLTTLPTTGPYEGDNTLVARDDFAAVLLEAIVQKNSRPFEIVAQIVRGWATAPAKPGYDFPDPVPPVARPLKLFVLFAAVSLGGLEKPVTIDELLKLVSEYFSDMPEESTVRKHAKALGFVIKSPRGAPRKNNSGNISLARPD
jgi:hypothetical protein